MACGQLVNRHRVWLCIGVYILLSIIITQLNSSFTMNIFIGSTQMAGLTITIGGNLQNYIYFALKTFIFFVLECAALFASTTLILKNKLNLQ